MRILSIYDSKPLPFLVTVVKALSQKPGLVGVCAGFELNQWRALQFADHIIEWIPEFALTQAELSNLKGHNAYRLLQKAALKIYTSPKYHRRGEIGEIVLHAVVRQEFGSVPTISKAFFKDAANDTVKGFDLVHVVQNKDDLELWLGESKIWGDGMLAVRDAIRSIRDHFTPNYLREEFIAICDKMESDCPHKDKILSLLDKNTALDSIFKAIRVPILIAYDSTILSSHTAHSEVYKQEVGKEFGVLHKLLADAENLPPVELLLILVPLNTKETLLKHFDDKLKKLQP